MVGDLAWWLVLLVSMIAEVSRLQCKAAFIMLQTLSTEAAARQALHLVLQIKAFYFDLCMAFAGSCTARPLEEVTPNACSTLRALMCIAQARQAVLCTIATNNHSGQSSKDRSAVSPVMDVPLPGFSSPVASPRPFSLMVSRSKYRHLIYRQRSYRSNSMFQLF